MISIEKINYQGWANSWQVTNGEVELVVTGDVGPRVMRYGFAGGQNFFKEFAGQMGKTGEAAWQPRGGHRLWIAPEDIVKSYAPDNAPVAIQVQGDAIVCTGTGGGADRDGKEDHGQDGARRIGRGIDP